jgi:hypothetical protein
MRVIRNVIFDVVGWLRLVEDDRGTETDFVIIPAQQSRPEARVGISLAERVALDF